MTLTEQAGAAERAACCGSGADAVRDAHQPDVGGTAGHAAPT